MKETVKTRFMRITSRRVAWVLVLLGVAWFVHVSPKTPLEFFDAAVRDRDAIQRRTMEKYEMIDAAAATKTRKYDEMSSCGQQMDRIALVHDLTNDPTRVQGQRTSIIGGFYDPSKQTDEYLKVNNESYRALAKKLEELRAEIKANKELGSRRRDLDKIANSDRLFQEAIFRMREDGLILRHFQGQIFWRKGR